MIRYDFTGKVALVTGSSRGIGAAILSAYARAGATCLMHFVDDPAGANRKDADTLAATLRRNGATVHLFEADVRSAPAVEEMMRNIKKATGGIDILVNNAGIIRDHTIRKMSVEDWHSVIETNLDGVFYCSKLALDVLRDGGRIVNISSISALNPFHGQSNYSAAKAGVIALTKVLSKELARRGITANAIAPGIVQTSMIGEIKPEVRADYERQIPVGRVGRPEDIANAVLFLSSEESCYITGQVLPVTGGW
jgi:3-oxoacyl-[acyl-carrier protein] reductase